MPPRSPHARSQLSGAAQSPLSRSAAERTIPEARASTYNSLEQALVPPAQSRANTDLLYQQRPSNAPSAMASDSRYLYYNPQEVQQPHGYPQYAAYETPQYAPNPARPIRNGVPQPPHPPPQQPQTYPVPPNGYAHPAAYVTPGYGGPAPHAPHPPPHWPPEAWQHFPNQQAFVPSNPPAQEPQQYANDGRADMASQAPLEPRAPSDNASKPSTSQQNDGRSPPPAEAIPQPKARGMREPQPLVQAQPPPPPPLPIPLDFSRLVDSYRSIIDSTNIISETGQINIDNLERMLQAATYGAQALDYAAQRSVEVPPAPPSVEEQPVPEEGDGSGGKPRQKPEGHTEGGQQCLGCKATSTPEWRRGPMGPRTLCNACGLVYAKLIKKRTREPGRSRSGTHGKHGGNNHPDGFSDEGSDQGSPDSQSRQSEVPDDRQG